MIDSTTIRETLLRMEDHEIVDRYNGGLLSDDAKPIAEQILRSRGVDPNNPPPEVDQDSLPTKARAFNPRLLPSLFGSIAAITVGRQVGALLGGVIGAILLSIIAAYGGWKVGTVVANFAHRQPHKLHRVLVGLGATLGWVFILGLAGVIAQVFRGARG